MDYVSEQYESMEGLSYKEKCHQNCLKMCHYVQKVYGYEVLTMDTDFSIDDNGKLWFWYAKNIITRPKKYTSTTNYNTEKTEKPGKPVDYAEEDHSSNEFVVKRMYNIMNDHYHGLKKKLGNFFISNFS
jgi:hypothetical protein